MVDGIEQTIIAPIVKDVVKDIQDKFIKDEHVKVYTSSFYEEDNVEVGDHVTTNEIGKSKLFVNFEYEDNEEMSYSPSMYRAKDKIILLDKQTGFSLRPISTNTTLTLTFNYKNKSKVSVQRVLNKLKNFFKFTGHTLVHSLTYSYLFPDILMGLMSNVSSLKGTSNVFDFIDAAAVYNFDYAVKRGSDFKVPSFRGKAAGVMGVMEGDASSLKISKEGELYTLEFSYNITFDKPNALAVHYPITVNNLPIDSNWLPKKSIVKSRERSSGAFDINRIIKDKFNTGDIQNDILIRVPDYDQFTPSLSHDGTTLVLLSLLIQLDPNEPELLLDLNDLAYIGIPDFVISYMKRAGIKDFFKLGSSLFYFMLFENNYIKDKDMSKNFDDKIVATKPLDPTKTYHLVVNVLVNRRFLRFSHHPESSAMVEAIETMRNMGIEFKDDTFALVQDGRDTNDF